MISQHFEKGQLCSRHVRIKKYKNTIDFNDFPSFQKIHRQ